MKNSSIVVGHYSRKQQLSRLVVKWQGKHSMQYNVNIGGVSPADDKPSPLMHFNFKPCTKYNSMVFEWEKIIQIIIYVK